MIIKKYPAPPTESAASRYDRDWLNIPDTDTAGQDDDRHDRTLLQQTVERKSRRYVDDGVSAVTGGAPVFDPDSGGSDPNNPNILWTDNFEGPELNERWTSIGGSTPILNPLRADESDPYGIRIVSDAGESTDTILDVNTFSDKSGSLDLMVASSDQLNAFSLNISPSGGVFVNAPTGAVIIPVPGEEISTISSITVRLKGRKITPFINGIAYESIDFDYDGPVMIVLSLVGGFIEVNSLSLASSGSPGDNGGGTPEPEEPEVPEGSYQEIYTENY